MKKLILLLTIVIFLCGCTNINSENYEDNINETIKNNVNNKLYNHIGSGYKYYLPKYMNIKNVLNYNEKINSNDNTYYLYIDIISYYNKNNIKVTKSCNLNYEFENNNTKGFLCINDVDDKYLVEIVYNYAKIEVKTNKIYLKEVINNSIIILSTIKYDNELIENLVVEKKLNVNEETLNIFKDKKNKEDFLEVIEEYDNYDDGNNKLPDYDVIN